MRLSQIKLAGFKSFVDPTRIQLPGQIVGVVGPNGCGKSNVIDALRWVLGESRASALRGISMQDVIFNGSDKRRPVARASVELLFDNEQGKAGGAWAGFAEISIGRVLQRNGESNYYINHQKVRRRDITDIFLGTGLGARAYAIVEQGMISRIIEAKPEELRIFLEEAAGVSKYRDRRRETSLRLNDTRNNLLRIHDILQQMDQQLLHLTEQSKVARQYRVWESRRNNTQHLLWLIRKQEAQAQRAEFSIQIEQIRTELERQTAVLRQKESLLESQRSQHYLLTESLEVRQARHYAANAEVVKLEQQGKFAVEQQQNLQQQIDAALKQIAQQQHQQQQILIEMAHWQQQQEVAASRRQASLQLVENIDMPGTEAEAKLARQYDATLEREELTMQQQLHLLQTQHDNLLRTTRQLKQRRDRLLQELENIPDPEPVVSTEAARAECEQQHAAQAQRLTGLESRLVLAEEVKLKWRSALQIPTRQLTQCEARLYALLQLQRDNEGVLQDWLQQQGLTDDALLWQSIQVLPGWENALEAVLRERTSARTLVSLSCVQNWSDMPPARLAVLEPAVDRQLADETLPFIPLIQYVQCQNETLLPVLREWLRGIYALHSISEGLSLRDQLPPGGGFVTPEGHFLDRHSVLFYAHGTQGVLARQVEIEQLESQLTRAQTNVAQIKIKLSEAERDSQLLELQIPPLRQTIAELGQHQHLLQLNMLKLTQALERARERRTQLRSELGEVNKLLEAEHDLACTLLVQMTAQREAQLKFKTERDAARQEYETRERVLHELRQKAQQVQHAHQEACFFVRTCQDKLADLQSRDQIISRTLSQSLERLEPLQLALQHCSGEVTQQALQIALQVQREAALQQVQAREALETIAAALQQTEQERLASERKLVQLREKLNELMLREQEFRLYFEQWDAQLQGVDVTLLQPLVKTSKPVQLQSELIRLDQLIAELGAVNLAALDEFNVATERKNYLDAQAQDLQQALNTLEEAIRHIDRESRALMMDTFNKVNVQLAELFPVLFAGGAASLVLTGEEILESGVQMMAQPPGKKNSSIHLLSGGEKALTAIALIFSLFQLNPAPFCLLDEVDAPLDDTNTARLCELIKKMAQHTQFVFITHNKIAMEMAQQLIGVTMQEKGVSKVVSVDIEAALRMQDGVALV